MVLSDIDIRAEIAARRLKFDPPIEDPDERIDSSAVDLLLHEELLVLPTERISGVSIVPGDEEVKVMNLLESHGKRKSLAGGPYRLEPHQLVLGKTLEYVTLPSHLAARIEGKSSLARFGLSVHMTAPTVMAGFQGHLVLEMYNSGPFHIELSQAMKIAQLILEQVSLPPLRDYSGQFQRQQ